MTSIEDVWNAYYDHFGHEPKNAQHLQTFSTSSNGQDVRSLSYKNAREILEMNEGKARIDISNNDDQHALVVLLCGLPGSGKTTLAKHVQQSLSSDDVKQGIVPKFTNNKTQIHYHHICYDSFLYKSLSEHKEKDDTDIKFDHILWKKSRESAFIKTESLITNHMNNRMDDTQTDSYSLIFVDDNMYFRSMRYKFYKIAKQYGTAFLIIYVNTHKDACIKRNQKRKGIDNVDEAIIERMSNTFEAPNTGKYNWESNHCFTFNTEHNNFDALYKTIYDSWINIPIQPKIMDEKQQNEARKINLSNVKHQTDLSLRKAMSKWMQLLKVHKDLNLSDITAQITRFRRDILDDVAKCVIDDEEELQLIVQGFEQQFNDIVLQYLGLIGIKLDIEAQTNDWKPSKVKYSK